MSTWTTEANRMLVVHYSTCPTQINDQDKCKVFAVDQFLVIYLGQLQFLILIWM